MTWLSCCGEALVFRSNIEIKKIPFGVLSALWYSFLFVTEALKADKTTTFTSATASCLTGCIEGAYKPAKALFSVNNPQIIEEPSLLPRRLSAFLSPELEGSHTPFSSTFLTHLYIMVIGPVTQDHLHVKDVCRGAVWRIWCHIVVRLRIANLFKFLPGATAVADAENVKRFYWYFFFFSTFVLRSIHLARRCFNFFQKGRQSLVKIKRF